MSPAVEPYTINYFQRAAATLATQLTFWIGRRPRWRSGLAGVGEPERRECDLGTGYPGLPACFPGSYGAPLQDFKAGEVAGSTRHMAASRHHTQPLFLPLLFLSSRSGNWWCWAN